MLIEQQLVTARNKTSKGTNGRKYITVHETANQSPGAHAQAHANLLSREGAKTASWHWTVDETKAIQSYPHSVRCWHAGSVEGNNNSIGIETCVNAGADFAQTIENLVALVQKIMREEGIPISRVVQHNKFSSFRKDCPHFLRNGSRGITWGQFLDMVAGKTIGVQVPPVATPVPPTTIAPPPALDFPKVALLEDGMWGAKTTRALQLVLPKVHNGGTDLYPDGDFGVTTKKATQRWLTHLGYYKGFIDGDFGDMSIKALQRFLKDKGLYTGNIDGHIGSWTAAAMQRYLNGQRQYLL